LNKLLKSKKFFAAIAFAMVVAILVPATVFAVTGEPGSADGNLTNQATTSTPVGTVGNLYFQGSTTVGPIVVQAYQDYNSYRGGTTVIAGTSSIIQNGSGDGRVAAANHYTDIGDSSGTPSGGISWSADGLNAYAIARDGIIFIVNTSVTGISNMTTGQIAEIYNGLYTNWDQITDPITNTTGPNMPIIPRGRTLDSGTRSSFKDLINAGNTSPQTISYLSPAVDPTSGTAPGAGTTGEAENWVLYTLGFNQYPRLEGNADMQNAINSNSATGECGYVGLGFDAGTYIKDINIVKSNVAYAPSGPNIYSGSYPLARFLYQVTANDWTPSNATTDVQNWLTWIRQEDGTGQQDVAKAGELKLIPDQAVLQTSVTSTYTIGVLDLIAVGNKVGQTTNLGRTDVLHNGSISVLDLIAVGNYCGTVVQALPSGVN